MGDPATLVESTTTPVVTATPTLVAGVIQDGTKPQAASKNGKKSGSGSSSSSSSSFFTWFIVLALLGVWTSVAVVYFDLVDYQGVVGKLAAYDADGDGDFDVEDAKVLLDEKPGDTARRGTKKDDSPTKDVTWKLREALKQQLVLIHERVQAKKIARLALAEVRRLLVKEEEEKELEMKRKEVLARAKERVAARLKKEEELIEREEMMNVVETLVKEKPQLDEKKKVLLKKGVGIERKDEKTVVKKPHEDEERASAKEKGKKN